MITYNSLCITCKRIMPIVWADSWIKVCYECADFFGWDEGKRYFKDNLSSFVTCNTCQNKFIPKKEGAVKCSNCWREYFAKRNAVVQVKRISQEVLAI